MKKGNLFVLVPDGSKLWLLYNRSSGRFKCCIPHEENRSDIYVLFPNKYATVLRKRNLMRRPHPSGVRLLNQATQWRSLIIGTWAHHFSRPHSCVVLRDLPDCTPKDSEVWIQPPFSSCPGQTITLTAWRRDDFAHDTSLDQCKWRRSNKFELAHHNPLRCNYARRADAVYKADRGRFW